MSVKIVVSYAQPKYNTFVSRILCPMIHTDRSISLANCNLSHSNLRIELFNDISSFSCSNSSSSSAEQFENQLIGFIYSKFVKSLYKLMIDELMLHTHFNSGCSIRLCRDYIRDKNLCIIRPYLSKNIGRLNISGLSSRMDLITLGEIQSSISRMHLSGKYDCHGSIVHFFNGQNVSLRNRKLLIYNPSVVLSVNTFSLFLLLHVSFCICENSIFPLYNRASYRMDSLLYYRNLAQDERLKCA